MPWCIVYFCLLLFCAYKTARHRHQQVILLVACNLVTFLSTAIARCVLHQFEHWERWRREVTTLSLLLLDISKSGWLPGPSRGPSIHKESYILRMKVVCCLWCFFFLSDWDTLLYLRSRLHWHIWHIIYILWLKRIPWHVHFTVSSWSSYILARWVWSKSLKQINTARRIVWRPATAIR